MGQSDKRWSLVIYKKAMWSVPKELISLLSQDGNSSGNNVTGNVGKGAFKGDGVKQKAQVKIVKRPSPLLASIFSLIIISLPDWKNSQTRLSYASYKKQSWVIWMTHMWLHLA